MAGIPGNWPTRASEPTQTINAMRGTINRSAKLSLEGLSLSPMNPKLSSNIVKAQPKTGFTKAQEKIPRTSRSKDSEQTLTGGIQAGAAT